jgi:hypothetical protein
MLMSTRKFVATIAATLLSAFPLLTGCEDSASTQRAEVQLQIQESSEELTTLTAALPAPEDDDFVSARDKLETLANDMGRVNEGEKGQKAAATLLASAANRAVAGMTLAEAERLEAQRRELRDQLHSRISAAMRLLTLVESNQPSTAMERGRLLTIRLRDRSASQRSQRPDRRGRRPDRGALAGERNRHPGGRPPHRTSQHPSAQRGGEGPRRRTGGL